MNNIDRVVKLANLYVYAVSQNVDILDTGRTIRTICDKINNFIYDKNLPFEEQKIFKIKFGQMAQNKFNKLVVPYLGIEAMDLDVNTRISREYEVSTSWEVLPSMDSLEFLLHDLIHEVLTPGSNKKFSLKDKEVENNKNLNINSTVYSLEEYIEEQVAESLTNKKVVTSNGLMDYIDNLISVLSPSNDKVSFDELSALFDKINDQFREDINKITNEKYKKIAEKFFHHLKFYLKRLLGSNSDLDESDESDSSYSLSIIKSNILGDIAKWISTQFNLSYPTRGFEEEDEDVVKPKFIADLTDDTRMSYLRRWFLAIDSELDKMISGYSWQLSFDF